MALNTQLQWGCHENSALAQWRNCILAYAAVHGSQRLNRNGCCWGTFIRVGGETLTPFLILLGFLHLCVFPWTFACWNNKIKRPQIESHPLWKQSTSEGKNMELASQWTFWNTKCAAFFVGLEKMWYQLSVEFANVISSPHIQSAALLVVVANHTAARCVFALQQAFEKNRPWILGLFTQLCVVQQTGKTTRAVCFRLTNQAMQHSVLGHEANGACSNIRENGMLGNSHLWLTGGTRNMAGDPKVQFHGMSALGSPAIPQASFMMQTERSVSNQPPPPGKLSPGKPVSVEVGDREGGTQGDDSFLGGPGQRENSCHKIDIKIRQNNCQEEVWKKVRSFSFQSWILPFWEKTIERFQKT